MKYPVVSEWDIRVFEAAVPEELARAAVYIPDSESELRAMADCQGLHLVEDAAAADVLLLGRSCWERFDVFRERVEAAIARGAGVVMLDVGERYLGQGYPAEDGELDPLQGVARVTDPKVAHYELFGGLSLTCTEAAEPESHLHPDSLHRELWTRLTECHTALWNGMRGGLIVPAADFDVQGLSREAFSVQWSRRGADIDRMKHGNYYAYELCGFFAYDSIPDNKELMQELRRKVEFLVEDAPALAMSVNPKAPIRITDLGSGYRTSEQGSASELAPLASAGKNLTRTPVMRIGFGPGKGTLILSGLLTEGRLNASQPDETGNHRPKYDEVAVQMVINMMMNVLDGPKARRS